MEETQQEKAPKFDATKHYQWKREDIFPLKGGELDMLKQILSALIQPAEAQRAIAAYEALKLVDGIIAEGVNNGTIVEAPKAEPENMQ